MAARVDLPSQLLTTGTATTTKSGSTATFTVNGVDTVCQVARDLTVAVGDVCLMVKSGSTWLAVQRMYVGITTQPVDNAPGPPPKPPVVTGNLLLTPVETASYRSTGWRADTDDVIQGEYGSNGNHTGVAFYGTAPRSAGGATVTRARVLLQRAGRGGPAGAQPLTFRLVTEATKPAGAPTLGSTTTGPSMRWGQRLNFTLPTSWGQALVDGTAGGIAIADADGDPYVIMDGRAAWSPAFALSLDYQRVT